MTITIEDIYTVANNELMKEFQLNRCGEHQEADWSLDRDWVTRVFDAKIDDETVDTVLETMIDELIGMGLLYTKKAAHGIVEVHKS